MMAHPTTCTICGSDFEGKTSYGLCPLHWSRDNLREFDRLESAYRSARRAQVPATLTLVEWLAILSDFNTRCAYCLEAWAHFIEMVDPRAGIVKGNVVPSCFSCHRHVERTWQHALERVQAYITGHVSFRVDTVQQPVEEGHYV